MYSESSNDIFNNHHQRESGKKTIIQSAYAKIINIQNLIENYHKEISSHVTSCAINHG